MLFVSAVEVPLVPPLELDESPWAEATPPVNALTSVLMAMM
jgi:hypothetical protein